MRKLNKIFLKICFVFILASFAFNLGNVPNIENVAYAAPVECTAPFASVEGQDTQCRAPLADGLSCTDGFTEVSRENNFLVCAKTPTTVNSNILDSELMKDRLQFIGIIQSVLDRLLWPILFLIGSLLDTSLIYGNGMEEMLRAIWVPIRNLVNIIFIIALVLIALYNILGIGEDNSNFSVKAALPKIILAIVAINFSFLAMKVVVDMSNLLTSTMFSLPAQVNLGLDEMPFIDNAEEQKRFCSNVQGIGLQELQTTSVEKLDRDRRNAITRSVLQERNFIPQFPEGDNAATTESLEAFLRNQLPNDIDVQTLYAEATNADEINNEIDRRTAGLICTGDTLNSHGKDFFKAYSTQNAALSMAINNGKLLFFKKIDVTDIATGEKVVLNTVFSLLLYIVFTVSFVALFLILLGRIIFLWAAIAFSPVMLLLIAAPELRKGPLSDLVDKFFKTTFAPVIIAAGMSVGWIMLRAIQDFNYFSTSSGVTLPQDATKGIPVAGLNSLQDILVMCATIGVVWVVVFAAAEGTIVQGAVDFIKDKVTSAAKFVGSIPLKHSPIFSVTKRDGSTGQYSYNQLDVGLDTIKRNFDEKQRGKFVNDFLDKDRLNLRNAEKKNDFEKTLAASLSRGLTNEDLKLFRENKNRDAILSKYSDAERKALSRVLLEQRDASNIKDIDLDAVKKIRGVQGYMSDLKRADKTDDKEAKFKAAKSQLQQVQVGGQTVDSLVGQKPKEMADKNYQNIVIQAHGEIDKKRSAVEESLKNLEPNAIAASNQATGALKNYVTIKISDVTGNSVDRKFANFEEMVNSLPDAVKTKLNALNASDRAKIERELGLPVTPAAAANPAQAGGQAAVPGGGAAGAPTPVAGDGAPAGPAEPPAAPPT